MTASRGPSSRYTLDDRGLVRLLSALDADQVRAGERYEALRQRLTRVFAWECHADAEGLADETLDRIARRMGEGVVVDDVAAYAHRVAELVLLEARRAGRKRAAALAEPVSVPNPDAVESVERLHECLERCLAQLEPDQRDLILRYYAHDGRSRIEQRDALARELGLQIGALRNRALRLREKLERCLVACLGWRDARGGSDTAE